MEKNKKSLPLQRQDKLKVFAVVSALKTLPLEEMKNSFALGVSVAYTTLEARESVIHGIGVSGKNPDDYYIGYMVVQVDADQLIDFPAMPLVDTKEKPMPIITDKQTVEDQMISNVRIMFNLVGTSNAKKIAEEVIAKFIKYSEKNKLSTK